MSMNNLRRAIRNMLTAFLLSGIVVGLTACPEKGGEPRAHESPDHAPVDHMGGGMM